MEEMQLSKSVVKRLNAQLNGSKKKTRVNLKGIPARDQCQSPPYALLPILNYLPKEWIVWEPAAGEGLMAAGLRRLCGNQVVQTDITRGVDFFETNITKLGVDCIITNPPFSTKYDWLERCYELNKPFALLMPVDVIAAAQAQHLFQRRGIQIVLMDKRVNFKMPNKGWAGSADFSVEWFCWGFPFLEQPITYAHIPQIKSLPAWMVRPNSAQEVDGGSV